MRTSLRARAAIGALLLAVTATSAAAAVRHFADVTGKWKVSVQTPNGASESLLDVKQTGDSLSGTINTDIGGVRNIIGSVKADTMRFEFSLEMQGQQLYIKAGALIKDKDTLEGEMSLPNGMGSFPFSGKRQP